MPLNFSLSNSAKKLNMVRLELYLGGALFDTLDVVFCPPPAD